jgi:hypothetical protein
LFEKYSELYVVGLSPVSGIVDLTRMLGPRKAASATERKGTCPFDSGKEASDV